MSNLQDVLNRANTDEQFRSRLKADPAAVCKEAGVEIPEEATFRVIECNRNDLHLVLGGRTNIAERDRIVERAEQNSAFKEQLLSDPRSAVQAATGESLPATCKVHVHEADPNQTYLFLGDSQNADGELSESEMATVAGGNPGALVGLIVGAVSCAVGTLAAFALKNVGTLGGPLIKAPPKPT